MVRIVYLKAFSSRNFLSFIILLSFIVMGSSQQSYQSSQYMLNPYLLNPAYAGLNYSLAINGNIRTQYSGLEGNPVSQNLNAHMPFYSVGGAAGISISNETLGAIQQTEVSISFNKIFDSASGILSIGLSAGVNQMRIDGSVIRTPEGNYQDGQINHNDPTLTNVNQTGISPKWNLGAFYVNKSLESGLNLTYLPENTITIANADLVQRTHINTYIKYKYVLSDMLRIEPSLLMKTDLVIYQTDLNLMMKYNGNVFGSIGVRGYNSNSLDAIIFMVGSRFGNNINAAYSYDAGLSSLKRVNEGSHELSIFFDLNKLIGQQIRERIIYNPRSL